MYIKPTIKVLLKVPEDLDPVEEDQDLVKEGGQDHEKGEQDPGIGIITDPEILKMKLMLREDGDEIIIMRGTGTDIAGDHITDTTMKVIMVITEEVVPLQLLLGKTRSTVSWPTQPQLQLSHHHPLLWWK